MATVTEARHKLGWRYRRGVPALLFVLIGSAVLLLGHGVQYTRDLFFSFHVENHREMGTLSEPFDVAAAEAVLGEGLMARLDDGTCWHELPGARLGQVVSGRVSVVEVHYRSEGATPRVATGAEAAELTAALRAASGICWLRTSRGQFVAPVMGSSIVVLDRLTQSLWLRGFSAFVGTLLAFALCALVVAAIVRRPMAGELLAGAWLVAALECFLAARPIPSGAGLPVGEPAVVRDALGGAFAVMQGWAPLVYLFLLGFVAVALGGLTTLAIDQVRGRRRCSECLAPNPVIPNNAPCGACGARPAEAPVEWMAVMAAVLSGALLLGLMLSEAGRLGFYQRCALDHLTEACRTTWARAREPGVFSWEGIGRRNVLGNGEGYMVLFRPAVYLAWAAVLMVVLPFLVAWRSRAGLRSGMVVTGVLVVTDFVVTTATLVPGDAPRLFMTMVQTHIVGGLALLFVGFFAAVIGNRVRFSRIESLYEEWDEDAPSSGGGAGSAGSAGGAGSASSGSGAPGGEG
jgi:hypothetical protein